jgi:YgiT-type zinc finger domain-containing protein
VDANEGILTHCEDCRVGLERQTILHQQMVDGEMFEIEGVPALVCPRCASVWIEQEARDVIEQILSANRAGGTH